MIADHKFDLIVNIPKNHSKRELTNGYRIRRGAIDHNIPLITNARLASAFIEAFCELKLSDIQIKSWQEYKIKLLSCIYIEETLSLAYQRGSLFFCRYDSSFCLLSAV